MLKARKLLILRSYRSDKSGTNADRRYTAGTRKRPQGWCFFCEASSPPDGWR